MRDEELLKGVKLSGHLPSISAVGWGEPVTYYVQCVCGWEGLPVHEKWFTDEEIEFSYFAEPWRTVAKTYGPDHTLNDGGVYGQGETAIKQVLQHLRYDPEKDYVLAKQNYANAVTAAEGASIDRMVELGTAVAKASEAVQYALQRMHIWKNVEVPEVVAQHPEAKRLFAEKKIADAKRREEEANRPLSDEEKIIWGAAGITI